ncbi:MAG: SDR family NAD(P)-dependent oxidoreductase [Clostridia bacterium]|nr:SDR family NAD(P)-dependent oxidoreductase [Clostridia bacterium]
MGIGIISGATSGIGKAIAKELDLLGLEELWLIGRRGDKLTKLAIELKTHTRCFPLDLTMESSINIINDELQQAKLEIEYLALCAGVGYTGRVENNTSTQIKGMIDLNCNALTQLISIALPHMSNRGKIINIASGAGFLPQADFAVYAATKAYVISLSRALRKELKEKGIKVTAVCPGPVDTEFFANLENVKEYKKKYLISPEKVAKGSIKASKKNKAIYTPSFSMKMLRLASKILPTSLLLKFSK